MKNSQQKKLHTNGFVLLLAVTLTSILLTIALGVGSIVAKEIKFGTAARAANDAFYAADNGIECASYYDTYKSDHRAFQLTGLAMSISCATGAVSTTTTTSTLPRLGTANYSFVISGLGANGNSCAKVTVFKDGDTYAPDIYTTITSKGYNVGDASCNSSNPDRIEREIKVTY